VFKRGMKGTYNNTKAHKIARVQLEFVIWMVYLLYFCLMRGVCSIDQLNTVSEYTQNETCKIVINMMCSVCDNEKNNKRKNIILRKDCKVVINDAFDVW